MLFLQFNMYTHGSSGTSSSTCAELKCQCSGVKAHRESVARQETGTHLGMFTSSEFLTQDNNKNSLRMFLTFCFFNGCNIAELKIPWEA